jgi:hypothetical protein
MAHSDNAFVTLTYDNENLPLDGSLSTKHLKDWQKRLRYYANIDLRFFSVGEYGEKTKRPHYHAAVFGLPGCNSGDFKCPCVACTTLQNSWQKGHVLNGTLTKDSAGYIAGYVTKKMTDRNPEEKYETLLKKGKTKLAEEYRERVIAFLEGRQPEFARMSNRPGIGTGGKEEPVLMTLQDMLETEHGCDLVAELNDVPDIIKIGGKEMLLGSYLKNKLRQRIGIDEKTKEKKLQQLREEKIAEYIQYRQETPSQEAKGQKEFLIDKHLQKVRNLEKRYSLHNNKGEL